MIRLIIVEDERVIRQGIEKHVPFEELGVDLVRTAENADEAFKICEAFKPDIIISDIMMPGMNGIQLCQKFKEVLPECQIIFISGYSDKEYLKAAIELRAVSYVEKPISIPELKEAIIRAIQSVEKSKRQSTYLLHSLLGMSGEETGNLLNTIELSQEGKILKQASVFCIFILHTRKSISNAAEFSNRCQGSISGMLASAGIHFLTDFVEKDLFVLLLYGQKETISGNEEVMSALWSAVSAMPREDEDCFWGIGKEVESLKMLPDSYQSALSSLQFLSFKGWNHWAAYDEPYSYYQDKLPEALQNEFHKALLHKDLKAATDILNDTYQMLIDNHAVLNFNVRNIYYTLDSVIVQSDRELYLGIFSKEEKRKTENAKFLDGVKTLWEMHAFVSRHVTEVLEENDKERKNNFIVKNVIEYIWENYGDKGLTIQVLAEVVYLTPTYLSNLFKEKTGMTIGGYLTEYRLKKAGELLGDPKLKLYQIADMVGYEDANYFAKLFKKKTGMIPSEYRENKLG